MKSFVRILLGLGACLALLFGMMGTAGSASAAPVPAAVPACLIEDPEDLDCDQPADNPVYQNAVPHPNLRIQNTSSNRGLGVCKDWIHPTLTWSTSQSQVCGAAAGSMAHHDPDYRTDTYYGWDDTDGVKIYSGYILREEVVGPNHDIRHACGKPTYWQKVQPSFPVTMTRKFYYKAC